MTSLRSDLENAILAKFKSMTMEQVLSFLDQQKSSEPTAAQAPAQAPAPAPVRVAPKRPSASADRVLEAIVVELQKHPEGLRMEGLRQATGYDKIELVKAIRLGLEDEMLTKTGEKRATTYFVPRVEPVEASRARPTVIRRKKA